MAAALTEPAKLLLLASLLSKDHIISNNGKSFVKELVLRRDSRLGPILQKFESKESGDSSFLEQIHELIMDEAQSLYDDLFFDTTLEVGKTLSKGERDDKKLTSEKSLIYGEVEFSSFYRVLRKINADAGKVFYDLGSGTGKAVFAARLTQDFSKCIGIEILHSLHIQAAKIVERYNTEFKSFLAIGQSQNAAVYEGSFLDFDWSDGDVVFANSTCFDDELMLSLSKMAEKLQPGAIVVTFTKGMTTTKFELLERKRYKMSWGPATVFIHRKLRNDGTPVGPARLNLLPSDNISYDDEVNSDQDVPVTRTTHSGKKEPQTWDEVDLDDPEEFQKFLDKKSDLDPENNDDDDNNDSPDPDVLHDQLQQMNAAMENQIRSISERISNNNKIINAFMSTNGKDSPGSKGSSPSSNNYYDSKSPSPTKNNPVNVSNSSTKSPFPSSTPNKINTPAGTSTPNPTVNLSSSKFSGSGSYKTAPSSILKASLTPSGTSNNGSATKSTPSSNEKSPLTMQSPSY
eukprot:gene14928-20080_t